MTQEPWRICLDRANEWRKRHEDDQFEPHAIRAAVLWNMACELAPKTQEAKDLLFPKMQHENRNA